MVEARCVPLALATEALRLAELKVLLASVGIKYVAAGGSGSSIASRHVKNTSGMSIRRSQLLRSTSISSP
jgi:hypothetical protein